MVATDTTATGSRPEPSQVRLTSVSTCATVSRDLDEPLAGTAATATTWLLLEQPGPWGAKALTSSHLDPAAGPRPGSRREGHRACASRSSGAPGGTPTRPPAAAAGVRGPHRPGRVWLHSATTRDPHRLLDLDFAALGRASTAPSTRRSGAGPTPATRSRSSAPTASATAAARSSAVRWPRELAASGVRGAWEVTHLGGHRFSPTLLVLPHGYAYGRVEAHAVKEVLHGVQEGRIVLEGCRGSSAWERPGQAAELAVRAAHRRGRGGRAERRADRRGRAALGGDRRAHGRTPLAGRGGPGRLDAAPAGELRNVGPRLARADGRRGGAGAVGRGVTG